MLSNSAFTALIDIRFDIALIDDFNGGFTFDIFEREMKTLHATTRALEIISEASRRLAIDLKDSHPGIPWHRMRSAGNSHRHDYDGVEESLVWTTATESLPPLLAVVEAELAAAGRDDESRSQD